MDREERLAQNEALFREVNERLRDVSLATGTAEGGIDVVCECADEDCAVRLPISIVDYERVRAHPRRFVVAPGHVAEVEHIAADHGRYLVVEKDGAAGDVAAATDPRG